MVAPAVVSEKVTVCPIQILVADAPNLTFTKPGTTTSFVTLAKPPISTTTSSFTLLLPVFSFAFGLCKIEVSPGADEKVHFHFKTL